MGIVYTMQQIAHQQGWAMAQDHDGSVKVEVPTEYGRSQVVQISAGSDPDGRPLAFIWSIICSVNDIGDPYYLLRLNADMPYGALAVRDPHVILVETQLEQSADHEELMRAVYYVGRNADELEKQVHGHVDRN